MTVTFFFNYLNHHQVLVADEIYRLLGDDFRFVATFPRNESELKGGADYSDRPYCLLPQERTEDMEMAHQLVLDSDVCVFGAGNLDWEKLRAKTDKLSFEVSERWFKHGLINILSPRLLKWWWIYQTRLRKKPFYKLCASAYAATDCRKLLTFKNRCFKWGYFTEVDTLHDPFDKKKTAQILWCSRFIPWKHPELVIMLAKQLEKNHYDFSISMYGDGTLRPKIERMISESNLGKYVKVYGNVPNTKVLEAMAESDIFLITSDRNEGWGAVVNEAMSCGCCVVANGEIGSAPYLIRSNHNGLIYDNYHSLYQGVKHLLDNPDDCRRMGTNAYKNIREVWSPEAAARNLLQLIKDIKAGKSSSISVGPCSIA